VVVGLLRHRGVVVLCVLCVLCFVFGESSRFVASRLVSSHSYHHKVGNETNRLLLFRGING